MALEPVITPTAPAAVIGALVDGAAAVQAARCANEALEAAVFAALVDASGALEARGDETELALHVIAAELGPAMQINDRTVQGRLLEAHTLVRRFRAVHHALAAAEITMAHARIIVDAALSLSVQVHPAFGQRALELARAESPNRLRPMLAAVAEQAQLTSIAERHRQARQARAAWVTDDADGMSALHAHLPSVLAHGILERVDDLARGVRDVRDASRAPVSPDARTGGAFGAGAGDPNRHDVRAGADIARTSPDARDMRTIAQTRADVLADLLATGVPTCVPEHLQNLRGQVSVTVPVLDSGGDIGRWRALGRDQSDRRPNRLRARRRRDGLGPCSGPSGHRTGPCRRPLCARQSPEASAPRPRRALPFPGLPNARAPHRHRSLHGIRRGRQDTPGQPRASLPAPPHRQARGTVEYPAPGRRDPGVHQPGRAQLHRYAGTTCHPVPSDTSSERRHGLDPRRRALPRRSTPATRDRRRGAGERQRARETQPRGTAARNAMPGPDAAPF